MSRAAAIGLVLAAACGGAGMGVEVRSDITARMQSAQAPISTCYATALAAHRKLKGMIIVQFSAQAQTGQFTSLVVTRDEVQDDGMRKCVLDEIGKLKLAKPQATTVSITYPIHFVPTK